MQKMLTEREAFAGVLIGMVMERCREARTPRTSRTGLQLAVPVAERPSVRRGLDALVEHGALLTNGETIGLTPAGQLLAQRTANGNTDRMSLDGDQERVLLQPLLVAIDRDDRLLPSKSLEEVRTLPARLENYQSHRSGGGVLSSWLFWVVIVAIVVALAWYVRR